jgi:hypothetical protein
MIHLTTKSLDTKFSLSNCPLLESILNIFEFISGDERHVDSIIKKLVLPGNISYYRYMPDFSEELEYTDKILYLNDLDGVSQVALMKELAQAAKELYKEYPEFCALIPFGSRTK